MINGTMIKFEKNKKISGFHLRKIFTEVREFIKYIFTLEKKDIFNANFLDFIKLCNRSDVAGWDDLDEFEKITSEALGPEYDITFSRYGGNASMWIDIRNKIISVDVADIVLNDYAGTEDVYYSITLKIKTWFPHIAYEHVFLMVLNLWKFKTPKKTNNDIFNERFRL